MKTISLPLKRPFVQIVVVGIFLSILFACAHSAKAQTTCPPELAIAGFNDLPKPPPDTPCEAQTVAVSVPSGTVLTFNGGFLVDYSLTSGFPLDNRYITGSGCPSLSSEITIVFSSAVSNVSIRFNGIRTGQYTFTDNMGNTTIATGSGNVIDEENVMLPGSGITSITITPPDPDYWAYVISGVYFIPTLDLRPLAGTIFAIPSSGQPDTPISVLGSGWKPLSANNEYRLYFDGVQIAQSGTPISCTSQPNLTFLVPCSAPGTHTIAIQLVDSITQRVLLYKSAPFIVTAANSPIAPAGGPSCQVQAVTIQEFIAVPKDRTKKVLVKFTTSSSKAVTLTLSTKTGTTGEAIFVNSTNPAEMKISETTTVEIKGITESSTVDNIVLSAKQNNKEIAKLDFSVFKVSFLEVTMPATKNLNTGMSPDQPAVIITNESADFATPTTSDLVAVFQSANVGPMVKVKGIVPSTLEYLIRWQADRDTSDTVGVNPLLLAPSIGAQITVTPYAAGNFRVVCYYDSNDNEKFDTGEELRVLRIAVVKMTLEETDTSIDKLMPSFAGVDLGPESSIRTEGIMLLFARVLLEGGGSNRLIGVDKIKIGNAGNLKTDAFQVNYPGDTVGKAIESPDGSSSPNGSLPMLDAGLPKGQEPTGGDVIFRRTSRDARGNGPNGLGKIAEVTSSDDPGFGPWKDLHPTTNNLWTTTQDGFEFTEFILAYSADFPRYYVAIAKADWAVKGIGQSNNGLWTDTGSTVMLQGSADESAPLKVTITNGSPQSGNEAGVQVLGLSYLYNYKYLYIP